MQVVRPSKHSADRFGDRRALYFAKNFHPAHAGVIAALQRDGYAVSLVVQRPRSGDIKNGASIVDVPLITMRSNIFLTRLFMSTKSNQFFPSLLWAAALLRRANPDLVVVYSHHASAVFFSILARIFGARVATLADKPRIMMRRRDWLRLFVGSLLRPRAMLHTGTYGPPGSAVRLGPLLGRSFAAPYPVVVESSIGPRRSAAVAPLKASVGQKLRILCMSCFNPNRSRVTFLLDAVQIAGLSESLEITFVRQSQHEETAAIRARESQLGLSPSTILLDVSDQELRRLYAESFDVLVYPAERVDYGQTIGEALAHGLPAICGDSVGARILIEHRVNGFVYESMSAQSLAEVLQAALAEGHVGLARMGEHARIASEASHGPAAWASTLEEALGPNRSRRHS